MPVVDIEDAEGLRRRVRSPYVPADYTVPPGIAEQLLASCGGLSVTDQLAERGTLLSSYVRLGDVVHGSERYARLLSPGRDPWIVDVAYHQDVVLPVGPEEAWQIARASDAKNHPPIEIAATEPDR